MSATGNIGYLTQLLAAMRQNQAGTPVPPTDAELEAVNVQPYDADLSAIASLTGTSGLLRKSGLNTWVLDTSNYLTTITSSDVTTALGYTPVTNARTLTINGVTYDLTANRSWTIAGGVTSFNTRTGAITLLSTDITSTLGYTPYNATNPAGYISSYTETDPTVGSHIKAITITNISNWNTAYGWGNHASAGYLTGITSGQVTTALGYTPENLANKGVANGYASLDGSGLIPSTQLPSYVDDVLEYTNVAAFPGSGVTGKIYVALDSNKIYRWSGTVYIEVSPTVGTVWGGITGTLANQTDLQTALDAKVPTTRTLTINGTAFDLSANRSWTINSMVYPAAGIAVSTGTAWAASITDNSTNWNTAYTNRITSLTVTGSSGSATLVSNVLNIPTYTLAGLGGQASSTNLTSLSGLSYVSASFVKMTAAGTFTLDTNTYYLSSNPSNYIALTALSSTATGLTYTNTTGVFSLTTGYSIPTTASQTNWDSAFTERRQWDGGSTNLVAATGRTSLGATTVGGNLFTLVNPTAITFIRINADNTVSTLDAATFRTAIGAGTSSTTGTVTSVSGTGTVSGLSLSGTVTTTGNITLGGTLAVTASNFSSQTANTFLAAPNGLAGVPTFRTIVAADIPTLNQNTTGSAGSVTNSLILKADTGTTEGTDLYTYNGSAAKTLNIVAGSNITITKVAGQWTIAGSAGGTSLNGTGFVRMSGTTPSYITGTSSQFVKADGSVDSSSYLTTSGTAANSTLWNSLAYSGAALASTVLYVMVYDGTNSRQGVASAAQMATFISGQTMNIVGSASTITGVYGGTLTSSQITTGLGYIPYNSTNPNGYISSYTETDTLASVTGRGNSTSTNIGSTSSGPLNFVTNGNIGTWIGGIQDGTSGWSLSSATIGFKSDNNTYATIGIAAANGLLYFGRTTTTVGTLTSWLEVNNGGTANFKLARPQYNGNTILDTANYNSYAPTLTGTGASGTWGINVTGSSASTTGNSATTSQRYFSGDIGTAGMGRFTGWYNGNATTALAAEIGVSAGEGYVITYNRGTSSYGNINIEAANVRLNPVGGGALTTNGNTILHAGNYTSYSPSLTGSGASGTWGISISGNAASATSATTATNWGSYGAVPAAGTSFGTANTIGRSDVNGYTFFYYINSSTANNENPAVSQVITTNGTDNYYRKSSIASFTGYVQSNASGNWGINITGNAATATSATSAGSTTYLAALGNYVWSASTLPTGFNQGIQCSFVSSSQGFQSYGSVMTMKTYSGGGGSLQLYTPYSPTYGGSSLQVRFGNYDGGDVWTSWKTLLQSDNYNSYAPTLTGTGASGTWGINVTGTAASISGYNNPTTAATANTIAYRDASGDISVRELVLGSSLSSSVPTVLVSMFPTTNQLVRTTPAAVASALSGQTMNINGSSTSCSGNAATATSATSASYATYLTSSNYIAQRGSQGSWNTDFSSTPAGTLSYGGDLGANTTNNPGGTWWFQDNYRHTNSSNLWGTQIAWGWEDNANKLAQRNVTGGTWGGWVYYLNSGNYNSYSPTLTGGGASGTWGISITGNANYATTAGSAPNGSNANGAYNVSPGEGNGVYFWSDSTNYTIKMGYTAGTYQYGPVTDYSMRFTMGAGTGRGFTWGYAGAAPTMGLNANSGNLQIAGTFTEASSIRYKEDIQDLTYSVEDVLKLRGVTYKKKGTSHTEIGVIAEEVNDIIPEVVAKNSDGSVESVSYGRLTAVLIEAVKEQQKQINELKELLNNR